MNEIEKYVELHDEIERCDFRMAALREDEADKETLSEVKMLKTELQYEIAPLKEALAIENLDEADQIRTSYIAIFNNYIAGFAVGTKTGKFMDLDQSMNPGYLLGMPEHDLFGALKTFGETILLSSLMYSSRKWEFNLLLDRINSFREKIMRHQFSNYLQGIEFYFEFRQAIRQIADKLRNDRVIY
jgi:hypothetical protein